MLFRSVWANAAVASAAAATLDRNLRIRILPSLQFRNECRPGCVRFSGTCAGCGRRSEGDPRDSLASRSPAVTPTGAASRHSGPLVQPATERDLTVGAGRSRQRGRRRSRGDGQRPEQDEPRVHHTTLTATFGRKLGRRQLYDVAASVVRRIQRRQAAGRSAEPITPLCDMREPRLRAYACLRNSASLVREWLLRVNGVGRLRRVHRSFAMNGALCEPLAPPGSWLAIWARTGGKEVASFPAAGRGVSAGASCLRRPSVRGGRGRCR